MIYRVRLHDPHSSPEEEAAASSQGPDSAAGTHPFEKPAAGAGAEARWFVGQIADRCSGVFNQDLPLAWSDLIRQLRQRGDR